MNRYFILFMAMVLSLGLAGCTEFGVVDQGRAVAFDKEGKTVTIVQDVKHDQFNPEYSGKIVTYKLPVVPGEMGPEPTPGGRLKIDADKKVVIIYNPTKKAIEEIAVNFTDVQKNIDRDHPLVKGKKFPVIDKEKNSITEYSARQKMLCTFVVPANLMDLPPATWEAGNEIRIYTKAEGQANRLMNISKTNIFRR